MSRWLAEATAVFAKDWRSEARTRTALNTLGLFALTTLVLVGVGLGPLGVSAAGVQVLPFLLWLVLLFAATAGLPRLSSTRRRRTRRRRCGWRRGRRRCSGASWRTACRSPWRSRRS
jgi:hypothetical protein